MSETVVFGTARLPVLSKVRTSGVINNKIHATIPNHSSGIPVAHHRRRVSAPASARRSASVWSRSTTATRSRCSSRWSKIMRFSRFARSNSLSRSAISASSGSRAARIRSSSDGPRARSSADWMHSRAAAPRERPFSSPHDSSATRSSDGSLNESLSMSSWRRLAWTKVCVGRASDGVRDGFKYGGRVSIASTRREHPAKGSLNTSFCIRPGINPPLSESSGAWIGTVLGRLATDDRQVQTTNESDTTEENRERRICNCVECHRVASIESGRGGLCVECFVAAKQPDDDREEVA